MPEQNAQSEPPTEEHNHQSAARPSEQEPDDQRLRVFLCHAAEDKADVRKLYASLQRDGFAPWLDEQDIRPGRDWQVAIQKAVRNSDVVVVCLSQHSITNAGYIHKEITFALDAADLQPEETIFIIPARLEECEVPQRLSQWQWVDLSTKHGYDKLVEALHERIQQLKKTVPPRKKRGYSHLSLSLGGLVILLIVLALWAGSVSPSSLSDSEPAQDTTAPVNPVLDQTTPMTVEIVSLDSPATVAPGESFFPEITVRPEGFDLLVERGDLLRHSSGANFSGFPHIAVERNVPDETEYTFVFYDEHPMVAPEEEGTYWSGWRVWADGQWVGPLISIEFAVTKNERPEPPVLTSPDDWAVYDENTDTIELCGEEQGDADGDSIAAFRFEIQGEQRWESNWIEQPCVQAPNPGAGGYEWRMQVKDTRGAASGWSAARNFTIYAVHIHITDFSFNPPSPSRAERIAVYASTNGCELMDKLIEIFVNTASDGTETGRWIKLGSTGNHQFTEADAPRWHTTDWDDGSYLVRVEAHCKEEKVVQDTVYVLQR